MRRNRFLEIDCPHRLDAAILNRERTEGLRYSPILPVMEDKYDSDVGSSHPGAGEGPKGMAVRHLKRYVSWVQTVVRQVGLNLL